ncbi:MAG TPA: transposase [Candidatus Brocadiaceae bacterium]|nr:transposase [Candidatus Brocadiaceae bacterium]
MTKREVAKVKVNNQAVERLFRESLSKKICGTLVGLWFLAAEHLRMGNWDLIKGYTGCSDADIEPRIALQIVNEAALCNNRIRKSNYITHQGFELLNGLGFLVTDEQVHDLLDSHTVSEAQSLQETLALIRSNRNHYNGNLIAIDPHRIVSSSQRIMPKKKKHPAEPSRKMLQTFFALDTQTGQPIGCGIGSPGVNTSKATIDLLNMVSLINKGALIMADKEHFTEYLIRGIDQNSGFEFLVPAISTERIQKIERTQTYQRKWAGYAIAESMFNFAGCKEKYRLISQREGETTRDYVYKSFLSTSSKPATVLLSEMYRERWAIEDFFNFDGAMGFDRASTFNLNIRYGKMSLALLAQAATYELRKKLPQPYDRWDSTHLAEAVLTKLDGDIRVKDDTIIVTCYNVPKELNLHKHYNDLPAKLISEGINPKIPWLYDFKLDFRFK